MYAIEQVTSHTVYGRYVGPDREAFRFKEPRTWETKSLVKGDPELVPDWVDLDGNTIPIRYRDGDPDCVMYFDTEEDASKVIEWLLEEQGDCDYSCDSESGTCMSDTERHYVVVYVED